MRALLLFLIGLAFGGASGFLAAGGMRSGHDHAAHSDAGHDHDDLVPWEGPAPEITLLLNDDIGDAVNLEIAVNGFFFAPERVNRANAPEEGHAHIYVNGEKRMRAYSRWVHLPDVPEGAVIRVTLNTNDHSAWAIDGQPITAEIIRR